MGLELCVGGCRYAWRREERTERGRWWMEGCWRISPSYDEGVLLNPRVVALKRESGVTREVDIEWVWYWYIGTSVIDRG